MPDLRCAAIIALLMTAAPSAYSWGPVGHRIVGEAAATLLCDAAAAQVAQLGRGAPLAQIGVWADTIRRQDRWRHTSAWHYVNVPDDGDPRNPPRSDQGNIVTALEVYIPQLRSEDLNAAQRLNALRFVTHFVADIHQPLHVGRAEDRGGNEIMVTWADESANLHAFWDSAVIALSGLSRDDYTAGIAAAAAQYAVQSSAADGRDAKGRAVHGSAPDVRQWSAQVFALRPQIYDFAGDSLDAEYLQMSAALAQAQLARASAALAATLNAAWCN